MAPTQPLASVRATKPGGRVTGASYQGQEILVDIKTPFVRLRPSAVPGPTANAQEGTPMRYVLLACVVVFAITCDLAVLIAVSDDAFETFDPLHPATLLPIVANGLHALRVQAGEAVNDLVKWFTAPYRERLQRPIPPDSLPA
jgi:hypothetical protein